MITKIFKWNICITIILLFFFVGTARAVDNDVPLFLLTPDDLTFDAGLAIEDAQYSLTKNVTERFEILNLSVERSLKLLGNARDPKDFKLLLEKYQQGETRLLSFWDNLNVRDAELIAGLMLEAINNRAQMLQDILENENPLRRTQDDLKQAIENMISSKEKHVEALTKAFLAHQQALKQQEEARSQAESSAPEQSGFAPGLAGSAPDMFSSGPGLAGFAPGLAGSAPGGFVSGRGLPGFIPPGFGGTPPGQDKDNSPTAEFCPVCGKLIHPQNHCICDDDDNSGQSNSGESGNNGNSGGNGNNGGPPSEFPGLGMDEGNAEPDPFTDGNSDSDSSTDVNEDDD